LASIHVRRRSGAALDDIHHELVQQQALFDVLAGVHDRILFHLFNQAQVEVRQHRRVLDLRERLDEQWIRGDIRTGDRKVLYRAERLDPPVGGGRDLPGAHEISLNSAAIGIEKG
jgi:hypothetical protein